VIDRALDELAAPLLARLASDLRASTGLELAATVRWVTPEEERAKDREWDRMACGPSRRFRRVGSRAAPWSAERPVEEYLGYWELDLVDSSTVIFEPEDVIDQVQEHVTEVLWGEGRSASWPECPVHGGHPLTCVASGGELFWRCPRDAGMRVMVGGLASDDRFRPTERGP
jgi:hypothetical protein